jgi:general secretion pathway protein G
VNIAKAAEMQAVKNSRQRGISTFELVLVIGVFTTFVGLFAYRFRYLQEYAEKTAVEMTVLNIRTGLRYRMVELMMQNRMYALPELLKENPVLWLEKPPLNYVGEASSSERKEIRPGNWYFDAGKKQLVYKLNLSDHFKWQGEGDPELRYGTIGLTQSVKRDDSVTQAVVGIKLVQISDGRWF